MLLILLSNALYDMIMEADKYITTMNAKDTTVKKP